MTFGCSNSKEEEEEIYDKKYMHIYLERNDAHEETSSFSKQSSVISNHYQAELLKGIQPRWHSPTRR